MCSASRASASIARTSTWIRSRYWRKNDAPDRQGITENLHVQNYLAYWDALRQRHPELIIDSCASGGRRNDLETMRRAIALHPTDYNYGDLTSKQAFHSSLFQWLPCYGSNTVPVDTVSAYAYRSGHAMNMVLGYDMRRKDLDYALLRKLAARVAADRRLLLRETTIRSHRTTATSIAGWPGSLIGPSRGTEWSRRFAAPKCRSARRRFPLERAGSRRPVRGHGSRHRQGSRAFTGSELRRAWADG